MAGTQSFEIRTARQFLDGLVEEDYKEFCLHPTSSRLAIHCALVCCHLADWVWSGLLDSNKPLRLLIDPSIKDFNSFRAYVEDTCPGMDIIREIANGSKHFGRKSPIVRDSGLADGAFQPEAFSDAFQVGRLVVETARAATVEFRDCLEAAVTFWRDFFGRYAP